MTTPTDNQELSLEGSIDRVTFHAPDSGWAVISVTCAPSGERVTAVGNLSDPTVGENVALFGEWIDDARYGRQFRFSRYHLVRPSTDDAIISYLSGGQVEGIGPVMAARIVGHFGEDTLDILDLEPKRLREVEGIGRVRAESIAVAWRKHEKTRQAMLFLHEHGITGALAAKIVAAFGDRTVEVVERDPYVLARRIRGVGFATADGIARSVGIDPRDPARLQAAMVYTLHQATGEGHLFLPRDELIEHAARLTSVEVELFDAALAQLADSGEVALEERPGADAVFLPDLLDAEREVAMRVLALASSGYGGASGIEQTRACVAGVGDAGGVSLSDEQTAAACSALTEGITVITGGPGTGKTTVIRVLVSACKALGRRVSLAAPTGRAAKRMGELAGCDASTIHRLLAYDPFRGAFTYHQDRPLEADTLIIDETSMVDLPLARDLLRAMPDGAQIIFIGDADQLPSVGPGNFFRDLVASEAVPVHRLTVIFRQAERSLIVANAHRLIAGEKPMLVTWKERGDRDCVFIHSQDPERAADLVIRAVTRELPGLGYGRDQIQVITPMHRGALGVGEINRRLQEALNPPHPKKAELSSGKQTLREGDRVLQVVNNYDKLVYNGEIGRVVRVNRSDRTLVANFDDVDATYEFSELDQLQLAYAMTIHKSQGSEYPVAVIVMHSTHYIMLRRNLLYTALTRAQNLAMIVGNSVGVMRAASNAEEMRRHTRLGERLRGEAPLAGRTARLDV